MSGRATGHVKLRRGKLGGVWYARYRLPDGAQQQKRIGPAWEEPGRPRDCYFTKRGAEAKLREILVDAERGTLAGMNKTGATFADACAEYLRYVEQVRQIDEATVKDYRGVIDGYLLDDDRLGELGVRPLGKRPIEAITPNDIDLYKEKLIAAKRPVERARPDGLAYMVTVPLLSNRTIVRHLTVLHGIFKRAARVWGLERNPASADLVERPRVVYTGEFDTFDGEEVELLAVHAADRQDAALFRVAAYTGLRQGELLALRWGTVDFVGGLVHVRRNYTDRREKVPKGKKVRSVPMASAVVDSLARLKEREHFIGDDDLVFCSPLGGHLDAWALRRRYYAAIKRAGLRRVRFHDLRHAFGTAVVRQLDPYTLQSLMGHQHYSTTQRYLHHKPRPEDAAAIERAFGGGAERASEEPEERAGPEREHPAALPERRPEPG